MLWSRHGPDHTKMAGFQQDVDAIRGLLFLGIFSRFEQYQLGKSEHCIASDGSSFWVMNVYWKNALPRVHRVGAIICQISASYVSLVTTNAGYV